jgi:trk system potassium uptake protein TrkA
MRVIVCGAGQVGTTIARHLAAERADVTVIDSDPELARRADESYDVRGMVGYASHPEVLERAGAENADMLIAVTRSDEVNMVACQVAHSLFGVKRKIARLRHAGYLDPERSGLFGASQMPIDVVISPEVEVARGIARRLRTPGAFDMVGLAGGRVQLLGIHATDPTAEVIGASLPSLSAATEGPGFRAVAILRQGRAFLPDPEERILTGDDVYVLTEPAGVAPVMAAFGHRERVARRVVLIGAGNVGLHLARILLREAPNISLKMIEADAARAAHVARELGAPVLVLHGDALDAATLEEANIAAADTVIAVTNDDETNIFSSMLAKRRGCQRAVTLVNKTSYEPILPSLGIDAAVSPSTITISSILRHIRRGAVAAVHTLREDFGEVLEAEALAGSRLVSAPLGALDLPAGFRIGAIVRQGEVILPGAETRIEPGDRVVAAVTTAALREAESLIAAEAAA